MSTAAEPRATVEDLHKVEGKAELIGGRIVHLMASGDVPSCIAFEIAASLREYAKRTRRGVAYADGMGFIVAELSSGRESFSPDASYYIGPRPANRGDFAAGPPTFAVEVRSKNDFGPAADRAYAAKRADYFEAGTLVVWDVDYRDEITHKYSENGAKHEEFRRGDVADAEPAVPGWTIGVDEVFGPPIPE